MEFKILTRKNAEDVISFCKKENMYLENNLIQNICNIDFGLDSTDHIGYGCFDNGKLVGYIGSIQHKQNGLIINDLSCGIVDKNYRCKGIASKLFDLAQYDGDVILDLTASEQVYQMFKRKFPRFYDFNEYQIWFNCKKLKIDKSIISQIVFDDYKSNISEDVQKIILDNSKYFMNFIYLQKGEKNCVVGYYTMLKKRILRGFEICYISDPDFFAQNYSSIIKTISKINKSFFCFCDKRFLESLEFKGKIMARGTNSKQYIKRICKLLFCKYIKAPNRKFLAINNNIDKSIINDLNYCYTEMCLYKDID